MNKSLDNENLPHSVGHFFEEQIKAFLENEKDEDKLTLKRGFCDWFWKWELVDTGVSDLKRQVIISNIYPNKTASCLRFWTKLEIETVSKHVYISVSEVMDRVHRL